MIFAGIPLHEEEGPTYCMGFDMNQNRLAVPMWSYAIDTLKPVRIIELGAYNGGFTMALAFAGWTKNVRVYSFDVMEAPKLAWRRLAEFLEVKFYRGDLFNMADLIQGLIQQPGMSFLLCDNGDKPREFNAFAPMMKPGDLIAAHDCKSEFWPCSEITREQIADSVSRNNLQPYMGEAFRHCGWIAYRRL